MNVKSLDDDIEEDIEEELSVADDLLKSDNSGVNTLIDTVKARKRKFAVV